jgi:hypothetical protein
MQPETAATMGSFGDEAWHIAVAKQGPNQSSTLLSMNVLKATNTVMNSIIF